MADTKDTPVTAESDRTVIITGGARGIGRSIVDQFHNQGCTVVAFDVNRKAIDRFNAEADGDPRRRAMEVSITDRDAVEAAVGELVEELGAIDVLVNNAGMTLPSTFLTQGDEDWDKIVAVNLTGTFLVSQVVARAMVERGEGSIVSISSISAHGVRTGPPSYAAAKAGVEGLMRLMAVQLGPLGVRVNTVVVGSTATPWLLGKKSDEQLDEIRSSTLTGQLGGPDDVANTVAFLASPEARHVHGQLISVSGGQWIP